MQPNASPSFHLVTLDVPDAGLLRVLVVAADPLARAGLAALVADRAGYAATAAPVEGPLDDALRTQRPDVLLWDVGLAGEALPDVDGLDEPALPLVALLPDERLAADAWQAGASGLLLRSAAPDMIAAALAAVHRGLLVVDPDLADAVLALRDPVPTPVPLTPREQEVLELLAEGLPNKLIADRLHISENTVKYHVAAILGKFDAHSRTEAVMSGARRGLLFL